MIITRLIGGLGNQMFQYAAGRRAAYINKTELKLDTSWFQNPERAIKRDYLLNVFNIKEIFANDEDINKLKGINENILKRIVKFIKPYYKQSYIKQRYYHFDSNILKIQNNTYLDGTWQSEKYFQDVKSIIQQEFTFNKEPNKENKKIINQIVSSNSVSVHIRRGDYAYDENTRKNHGVCDVIYYIKAVSFITSKIKSPLFFIFSDDPLWVKQNLRLELPCIYVDHNCGKKDYEDLRLMINCHHNIVANSTFSWWGAWLNNNPNKIVIAPKTWFNNKAISEKDLILSAWSLI